MVVALPPSSLGHASHKTILEVIPLSFKRYSLKSIQTQPNNNMSTDPCISNDYEYISLSNGSNDSGWGIQQTRGNGKYSKGSGCKDLFATAALEVEEEEVESKPEDETEPEDVPAPATELADYISCNRADAGDLVSMDDIDLEYDYEIHTVEDADLVSSVKTFELDLLKAVALKFDLTECDVVINSPRRSLRNGRKLSSSTVVGIGSYPDDLEDSIHTECEVDVDSIETEESDCTPMNGRMTAWVDTTGTRRLSESDLYEAIADYSKTYSNDRVLAVTYIGTRPDDVVEANAPYIDKATKDDGNTANLAGSSSAMSPGAIVGIAVGSMFALLALLALFAAKKRRDRKNAEKNERSSKLVNDALFMIDEEDDIKQVDDDASKSSVTTEDHTFADTLPSNATFESESPEAEEAGFEIQI